MARSLWKRSVTRPAGGLASVFWVQRQRARMAGHSHVPRADEGRGVGLKGAVAVAEPDVCLVRSVRPAVGVPGDLFDQVIVINGYVGRECRRGGVVEEMAGFDGAGGVEPRPAVIVSEEIGQDRSSGLLAVQHRRDVSSGGLGGEFISQRLPGCGIAK